MTAGIWQHRPNYGDGIALGGSVFKCRLSIILIRAIADLKSSCLFFGLLIDIDLSVAYLNMGNLLLLLTL